MAENQPSLLRPTLFNLSSNHDPVLYAVHRFNHCATVGSAAATDMNKLYSPASMTITQAHRVARTSPYT